MGEAPFIEDGACHRRRGTGGLHVLADLRVVQQPPLETLRIGVFVYDAVKNLPLDRKAYRIGCLIALAFFSAPVGGFECRKQSSADIGWTK
jgi:hypothetical protein